MISRLRDAIDRGTVVRHDLGSDGDITVTDYGTTSSEEESSEEDSDEESYSDSMSGMDSDEDSDEESEEETESEVGGLHDIYRCFELILGDKWHIMQYIGSSQPPPGMSSLCSPCVYRGA